MRLIDDLLKDDFFRGGYKAEAAKPKFQVQPGGDKKPWGIIVAVAAVVLLVVAGAGWFFLSGSQDAAQTADVTAPPTEPTQVAAVIPPPMPSAATDVSAAAFTEGVTESSPASDTDFDETVADFEDEPAVAEAAPAEEEAPAAAEVAPAAKPEPVAAPVARQKKQAPPPPPPPPSEYRLSLPAMGNPKDVINELRRLGIEASAVDATYKKSVYRVLASRNVSKQEANTIKIKADIFGLDYETQEKADGTVLFDFGTFDAPAQARKVAAEATKFGIEVRAGRQLVNAKGYQVRTGTMQKATADKAVSALARKGVKAALQEVTP